MSPSPSTSAANTLSASFAAVLMVWAVKFWLPSFSYQAILSSLTDAERTSVSPSPSTSAANTLQAPFAAVLMVWAVKFWLPSFSYQAILSSIVGRGEDVGVAVAVHVRRKHARRPSLRRC